MSDFHQNGIITNFHNLKTRSPESLEREVFQLSRKNPVGLILPSLFSEFQGDALPKIVDVLSELDYIDEIIVGLDQATESEYKHALNFLEVLPHNVKVLWNGGTRLRKIDALLKDYNLSPLQEGKGRNVWYMFGYLLASNRSKVIAIHDCDILTYHKEMLTRLIYPVLNPSLNFSYSKGYYARIANSKMNGRVCRLLITPLISALKKTCGETDYLEYMDSFKYALSGEFAFKKEIISEIRIPSDWGLEMGMLSEIYRNHKKNKICQVDISDRYDHKHQELSSHDQFKGLTKMSADISKSLFRKLATFGEEFSTSKIRTIKASYYRIALDLIDLYESDSIMNGLHYDRHKEMQSVEVFAESIMRAGNEFLNQPTDTPFIPSWKRVLSAIPDIYDQLIDAVDEDMEIYKPKSIKPRNDSPQKDTIEQHVKTLYPSLDTEAITEKILTLTQSSNEIKELQKVQNKWSENDIVLITYGDSIQKKNEAPLNTLKKFLHKNLNQQISTVHILPFTPYSSDDGFSVIDYYKVDAQLGDWSDIQSIKQDFDIMADLVINHCSQESEWFQNFTKNQDEGKDFFISVDDSFDTAKVIRSRSSPLLKEIDTAEGKKKVWCTFSHDQIDLNFKNPEVLFAFIRLIKFLVSKDIRLFRLDAVAFLWKATGTSCIHLKETHELVKLIRLILERLNPQTILITETNVPNRENLSYFGNDNEAHLIYNFSLPPLLVFALLKGDATHLKTWMMSMPPARKGRSYLNFIASHDGIGIRPLEGLVSPKDQEDLLKTLKRFGGTISNRKLNKQEEKPYELNISLFDAFRGTIANGADAFQIQRFICAHTILLALEGIPAFYIHSLLGTENANALKESTGQARSINRYKWQEKELREKLGNPDDNHSRVFKELKRLIEIRKKQSAFHPNATQLTLHLGDALFAFWRESLDRDQSIFAIHNVSDQSVPVPLHELNLISTENWQDLISGEPLNNLKKEITLKPYESIWLSNT
tara:strand:- start:2837 stop:5803 length:2967 start_codon:yes stop_codon:yes gene_type:complete